MAGAVGVFAKQGAALTLVATQDALTSAWAKGSPMRQTLPVGHSQLFERETVAWMGGLERWVRLELLHEVMLSRSHGRAMYKVCQVTCTYFARCAARWSVRQSRGYRHAVVG